MWLCQSQEGNKSEARPISADAWEQEHNDLRHKAAHSVIRSQKPCSRGHDPAVTRCGLARGHRPPRSGPWGPTGGSPRPPPQPQDFPRGRTFGQPDPLPSVAHWGALRRRPVGTLEGRREEVSRLQRSPRLSRHLEEINDSSFLKRHFLIFQLQQTRITLVSGVRHSDEAFT